MPAIPVKIASGDAVDDLPEDEPDSTGGGEYELAADFLAFMRGGRFTVAGDLHLIVAVPPEYISDAVPLTQVRGLMFRLVCYRPVRNTGYVEVENDIETSGFSGTMNMDIEDGEEEESQDEEVDAWEGVED